MQKYVCGRPTVRVTDRQCSRNAVLKDLLEALITERVGAKLERPGSPDREPRKTGWRLRTTKLGPEDRVKYHRVCLSSRKHSSPNAVKKRVSGDSDNARKLRIYC